MVFIKILSFLILIYGIIGLILSFALINGKDKYGNTTADKKKIVLPFHKIAILVVVLCFLLQ